MAKKKVLGYRVRIYYYGFPFYCKRDRSMFGFNWLEEGDRGPILSRSRALALLGILNKFCDSYGPEWRSTIKLVKVVSRG